MAAIIDFSLSGDVEAARRTVLEAAVAEGYTVDPKDEWTYLLERGNKTTSLLLGGLAGKNFYLAFQVGFSAEPGKGLVARFSRDSVSSALRGGALGVSRASKTFDSLIAAVGSAARSAGILTATAELG